MLFLRYWRWTGMEMGLLGSLLVLIHRKHSFFYPLFKSMSIPRYSRNSLENMTESLHSLSICLPTLVCTLSFFSISEPSQIL